MDSTTRFTDKVENYVRYRPGYPLAIVAYLQEKIHLTNNQVIADIGSGTGISSEVFLKNGNKVLGVEPNDAMRAKAEWLLQSYPNFTSIKGTAENTNLDNSSIDMIIAGQAFHWFDQTKTKIEFKRIAKPEAFIVLMWNIREVVSPFSKDYEELLVKFGTDYSQVGHKELASEDKIIDFFSPCKYEIARFNNVQLLDYEGLKGRLLSTSYVPEASAKNYLPMLRSLEEIFDRHQQNGKVNFDYTTILYTAKAHC